MHLLRTAAILAMVLVLSACTALFAAQRHDTGRLNAFPTAGWPTQHPVTVRWNDYQVPFVEAQSDDDLAFALGVIHHHLRAGQMRVMKQISQGRIAEMAGPPVRGVDEALRILDFGYAAPTVVEAWPDETRRFVEAFVDGLNWHQANAARPPEMGMLGLEAEPWTAEDLVTIGRLAGTDVNWLAFFSALRSRLEPNWPETWQRIKLAGLGADDAELEGATDVETLASLLAATSKAGSNSLAIAPSRSKSGAALIANDPHLGLNLPNLWLLAGIKSPSYHAVGMMIPGLPFMGLGRNEHVAWGGTNARALSSDLVNVAGNGDIAEERVTLRTRWWFDREIVRRRSPEGPILSDSSFIQARPGEELALRWVGHEPTDEITAFLQAMRATDAREFRQAFATYGVSAQNMLVADRGGSIAMVMAAQLPQRGQRPADDFVLQGASEWNGFDTALTMDWVIDPESGFIASANDRPDYIGRPAGYFFSPKDRVHRMATLVEERGTLGVEDLFAIQLDVVSEPAGTIAEALVERADALHLMHPSLDLLRHWDGNYAIDAKAPVVFETLLYHLTRQLYANANGNVSRELTSWANLQLFLLADLDARTPQERLDLLQKALENAAPDAARYANWGEMHRIRVGHVLGNVPVIGTFFRIADLPSAGSRETLMKRSHNLENARHRATFGAQSRHVSDLADPDANWFVLFGGQDGWLGSANFADQVDLWKSGSYIQLPLTAAKVEAAFPRVMRTTTSGS